MLWLRLERRRKRFNEIDAWTFSGCQDNPHKTLSINDSQHNNSKFEQRILKGEVSLYCWPPVRMVWNQLYDNWQFLFLFAKQTNLNQSNRRSMVQWYFPLYYSLVWVLSCVMPSVMLNVIMSIFIKPISRIFYCFGKCCCAKCRMSFVIMSSAVFLHCYGKCHFGKSHCVDIRDFITLCRVSLCRTSSSQ